MTSDFVLAVFSSAAVSAALCGLLLWLTKAWVAERMKGAIKDEYDTKLEGYRAGLKAEYDKQLETHKAQLRAGADMEVERLKSALMVIAAQHNTTFTQLHARRVEVIADTYARLKTLHGVVANYVKLFVATGERSTEDRRNSVITASEAFTSFFSQNQIFLTKGVAASIERMNMELVGLTNVFFYAVDLPQTADVQQWTKIAEKFNGSTREALESLEEELRTLLGDKS